MPTYTAEVYPLKNSNSPLAAFATLNIHFDEVTMKVDGFRVINRKDGGIFVSAPSQKSTKTDEETGKPIYFTTFRWVEPKAEDAYRGASEDEAYKAILDAYHGALSEGSSSRQSAAQANGQRGQRSSSRPADPMADGPASW